LNIPIYVFLAFIGAGVFGVAGYYKNKIKALIKGQDIEFDQSKFWISVIGTIVLGLLGNFLGLTPEALSSTAFGIVLTQFLRKIWSILFS